MPVHALAGRADDAPAVDQKARRPRARPDIHTQPPRMPAEDVNVGLGIRQHVMHAGLGMGRLGHGAKEFHTHPHQPAQRFAGMIDEQPPEHGVVALREPACEPGHVLEMFVRAVLDAVGALMGCLRRGEGADGQRSGAAEVRILFY